MVQQRDVDRLIVEMEAIRAALTDDREAAADRLESLIRRAGELRENARGGPFEHATASVHDLLETLSRGVAAQTRLTRAAP